MRTLQKPLFLITILLFLGSCSFSQTTPGAELHKQEVTQKQEPEPQKDVYICKGKYSKRYHLKKDCGGLGNCSIPIYKVDLSKAERLGRSLCGRED